MSGWTIIALLGTLCFAISLLVWAVILGGARRGAAEEELGATRRQIEALGADQRRADDIERKAKLAREATPADSPLAERLRDSGRARRTPRGKGG